MEQAASLIAKLTGATTDDEREAAVTALALQPPSRVLPLLQEARVQSNSATRFWIDAAIQQIQQKQAPGVSQ